MQQERERRRSAGEAAATSDDGDSRQDREPAISVTDLCKAYGSGEDALQALDGVSFDIQPGTVVGILGPNGAGKTTLIKSILSLIVPTDGSVSVHGKNVYENPRWAFRNIGAMFEGARNTYWRLTVRENLEMFSVIGGHDYRDRGDRIDELLATFDLEEKADTVVRELSRGQKQKVTLSCTMARDADIVFLDEPTLGLDVESSLTLRRELRRLVEDEGTTMVLSSHDMDVIQAVCDRVIILHDGEILVDDSVESLLDVFETQTYRIAVEESPDKATRERLRGAYGATNFERRREATQFEANVAADQFYGLVDELRAADLTIRSFDRIESNLEEVFLHVTDEAREAAER